MNNLPNSVRKKSNRRGPSWRRATIFLGLIIVVAALALVAADARDGAPQASAGEPTTIYMPVFFMFKHYDLNVAEIGNGNVSLNPAGGTYHAGTTVTLTAVPESYWEFSGWSGDASGATNPITVKMDADKAVTAIFTIKQYDLIAATVGPGSIDLNPGGGSYDAGTVVTLMATAGDPDYEFTGWSGDLGGSTTPVAVTMDADKSVTATFTLKEPLPPPVPLSGQPPLDFAAIQADFQSQGFDLAFNKIGFHVGPGGNPTGIGDWWRNLDSAGVPVFYKSVDDDGHLWELQEHIKSSGSTVPHTLVYRMSSAGQNDGNDYDVPDYNKSPVQAARDHWKLHTDNWPSRLDPSLVWIETTNEVDKNKSEWLGEFAVETANLALRDGFRWAAFGWSSGEPEPEHWESPAMLEFLEMAAAHPDRLAIALHEYSYDKDDIGFIYPYLIGRFQKLFMTVDKHYIPRPTVLITEWGWEYQNVPGPSAALDDIAWAAWLYAAYPEIKGAALWYLGPGFGNIASQAQKLISPVTDYSLSDYFKIVPGHGRIEPSYFEPPEPMGPPPTGQLTFLETESLREGRRLR
jgi:uncharacterized repeat protein (TIGR02543 family)